MHFGRAFQVMVLAFAMAVLAACDPPPVEQRLQTAKTSTEQSELGDLAANDTDARVRDAALARLTDEGELARVVTSEKTTDWERRVAFGKIVEGDALDKIANYGQSDFWRQAAESRLHQLDRMRMAEDGTLNFTAREGVIAGITDPVLLAHILFALDADNNADASLEKAVFERLKDPVVLYRIATEAKNLKYRIQAVSQIKDQKILKLLATGEKAAAIRLVAIAGIKDNAFLFDRSQADPSNTVRSGAVEVMTDQEFLARVVMENDGVEQRYIAGGRLKDRALIVRATQVVDRLKRDVREIGKSNDTRTLVKTAVSGNFDVLRMAAAARVRDQSALGEIAIASKDRTVNKIVFAKLSDKTVLGDVVARASLSSVRLAARVKLGQTNWTEVFQRAAAADSRSEAFGEALAAADLFSVQNDAKNGIVEACLDFIRRGDESRIPELIEMLKQYGDVDLAEDYLNCGQPDLEKAATDWASDHGYSVGSGSGSHRATWGSN